MKTTAWLNRIVSSLSPRNFSHGNKRRRRQLAASASEALEVRTLLTPIVVSTDTDIDDGNLADGELSLREAIRLANEDGESSVISVSEALAGATITLRVGNGAFRIIEPVQIAGPRNGNLVIDANQHSRIFSANANLTIRRLTLQNARAQDGAAIFSSTHVDVLDSVFSGNETTGSGQGGAIKAERLVVSGSTFENNSSGEGGAIQADRVEIRDSTFLRNTAQSWGGAVTASSVLDVGRSTFEENRAEGGAGAIVVWSGSVDINDSNFRGNSSGTSGVSLGGAVVVYSADFVGIRSSTFSENSTSGSGGALWVQGSNIRFENTTIVGNATPGNGGAAVLSSPPTSEFRARVFNSTIAGNSAQRGGGLFAAEVGELQLQNSIVAGNTAIFGPDLSFTEAEVHAVSSIFGSNVDLDNARDVRQNTDWKTILVNDGVSPTLTNNHGRTPTVDLLPNSLAVDAGTTRQLLVRPTSAVSSTAATDLRPASNLIDSEELTATNWWFTDDAPFEPNNFDNSWITNGPNGSGVGFDYFANDTPGPVLTFDLGGFQLLSDIVVWGYETALNNDVKDLQIEFSTDGGQSYSNPVTVRKPRYDDGFVHRLPLGNVFAADTVRVTILDNYFGEPGNAAGSLIGLDEIRFLSTGGPELDQRGFLRPFDGNGDLGPENDIGAVETGHVPSFNALSLSSGIEGEQPVVLTLRTNVIVGSDQTVELEIEQRGNADFEVPGTNIVIPAGSSEGRIELAVPEDDIVEETTKLIISLFNPLADGAPLFGGPVDTLITDNDEFEITGPRDAIDNVRPTLTWNRLPDATSYEVALFPLEESGQGRALVRTSVTSGSLELPNSVGDLGVGRYRTWVRATLPQGTSDWISRDFQISVAPEISVETASANDTSPKITWAPVPSAVGYRVYVSNHTANTVIVDEIVSGDRTSYTPPTLTFGRHDIWVRAIGPQNYSAGWSARETHYIGPQLIGPVTDTFNRRPTFSWSDVPDVDSYRLLVMIGNDAVIDEPTVRGTSFTPSTDLPIGNVRWWILPKHANRRLGAWSARGDFHSGGRPSITGPGEITADGMPTITWNPVDGAGSFEVYLYDIREEKLIQNVTGITGTSFTAQPLQDGHYRVWVRSFRPDGKGELWSRPLDFEVAAVTTPLGTGRLRAGGSTFDSAPALSWEGRSTDNFDIVISNGEQTIVDNVNGTSWTPPANLSAGLWKWWIRYREASGDIGPWTETAFSTTGRPSVLGVEPGISFHRVPYSFVVGAEGYEVYVEDFSSGRAVLHESSFSVSGEGFGRGPSYEIENSLLDAGTYRVWLRAVSFDREIGPWSRPLGFTVN